METNLGTNIKVAAEFEKGDLVVTTKIGMVEYAEKAVDWVKSRRPGGIEDPVADGFLALIKQIAGEETNPPKTPAQ